MSSPPPSRTVRTSMATNSTNNTQSFKDLTSPRSPLTSKTRGVEGDLSRRTQRKRQISFQNRLCQQLNEENEDHRDHGRSWSQIQQDMIAMDKLHDTSFLKWVRDENNATQVGKNLSTIVHDYSIAKQVSVFKWLFVDWHLQSIISCLNSGIFSAGSFEISAIISGLCQDWDVKHVAEALALLFFVPYGSSSSHNSGDNSDGAHRNGERLCIETLKGLTKSLDIHRELCKIIKSHNLIPIGKDSSNVDFKIEKITTPLTATTSSAMMLTTTTISSIFS